MEKEKSGTAKSNWLSWIRDLVIVNIGVALFVVLVGLLPLWAQVLPIFVGFFIALSLCRERRVRRAFTLFAITWLIFATTIMIEDQGDVFFTYAVSGVFILLLMLGGLGFSFIISQPRDAKVDPTLTWKSLRRPITWKGVGIISFLTVMILLASLPQGGHSPNYDALAKSTLKNLATLQEEYYVQHETYATDLDNLVKIAPLDENVEIKILRADKEGWAATGSHMKSDEVFTYISGSGIKP